jgi:hypothetical protein
MMFKVFHVITNEVAEDLFFAPFPGGGAKSETVFVLAEEKPGNQVAEVKEALCWLS